jgi:hypothetical protein
MLPRLMLLALPLVLLACTPFPEVEAAEAARLTGDPAYLDLLSPEEVAARSVEAQIEPDDPAALQARAAGLRARAAALDSTATTDEAARARMDRALQPAP